MSVKSPLSPVPCFKSRAKRFRLFWFLCWCLFGISCTLWERAKIAENQVYHQGVVVCHFIGKVSFVRLKLAFSSVTKITQTRLLPRKTITMWELSSTPGNEGGSTRVCDETFLQRELPIIWFTVTTGSSEEWGHKTQYKVCLCSPFVQAVLLRRFITVTDWNLKHVNQMPTSVTTGRKTCTHIFKPAGQLSQQLGKRKLPLYCSSWWVSFEANSTSLNMTQLTSVALPAGL